MDLQSSNIELPFFTILLILLVTAKLFGEIFERFRQPAMIGEILAGIILGPSLLNYIHRTEDIKIISELGIFLLVILAGLEINIDDILKSLRGKSIITSISAFFIPLFSGFLLGYLFDLDLMTIMFIGLCISITALPVSIRILMDLGKLNSDAGKKIISIAIFDDVLALTILGILLNINDTNISVMSVTKVASISLLKLTLFVGILALGYYIIKKLTKRGNYIEDSLNKFISFVRGKETLFAIFFVFVLIFSTITESLGFHFIIGAFFASMLINKSIIGKKHLRSIERTTSSLAMGFLAPIFFAGIGLEFNISSIHNLTLLIAVVIISYLSKILGGFIGSKLAGFDNRISFIIGLGLNARGIMELVIANIAYKASLINTEIFSILVIMGVLTTLTTPIMLKWSFKKTDETP